jgi:hypothetical protein
MDKLTGYFRIKEAAEIVGVSPNPLRKRITRGKSLLVATQPTDTGNTSAEAWESFPNKVEESTEPGT